MQTAMELFECSSSNSTFSMSAAPGTSGSVSNEEWYQESMGQIQTPSNCLGLTWTPSSLQRFSRYSNFPGCHPLYLAYWRIDELMSIKENENRLKSYRRSPELCWFHFLSKARDCQEQRRRASTSWWIAPKSFVLSQYCPRYLQQLWCSRRRIRYSKGLRTYISMIVRMSESKSVSRSKCRKILRRVWNHR